MVYFNKMNRFIKSINFSLIFLLLLLFIIVSCRKNADSSKLLAETATPVSELADKDTLVFGSNRAKNNSGTPKTEQLKEFIETEQSDIKGQLFPLADQDIIPEDMIIGPLLDFDIVDVSTGTFPSAILSFFRGAENGRINEEVLHPSFGESIKRIFNIDPKEQSYTVRIGKIVVKNGTSSANIRLVSDIGRVSGDITADNFEGRWLLSDISIDMELLKNTYLREVLEFNPLSYSNILLNY